MEKNTNGKAIYLKSLTNKYRYALGTEGEKTLYCFGINPSTATNKKDDSTIRKVKSIANKNGFDSVIMLNIYPQRATKPDRLSKSVNLNEHKKNLQIIADVIKDGSVVWAAWGDLINKRTYLNDCLADIQSKLESKNVTWVKMGKLTKKGNPRHPLYIKYETFTEYVIN